MTMASDIDNLRYEIQQQAQQIANKKRDLLGLLVAKTGLKIGDLIVSGGKVYRVHSFTNPYSDAVRVRGCLRKKDGSFSDVVNNCGTDVLKMAPEPQES